MLNSIYTFSSPLIPVVQEKVGDALSDVQKRTALVALVAVSLLTVALLMVTCFVRYRQLRRSDIKLSDIKEPGETKIDSPIAEKKEEIKKEVDSSIGDKKQATKVDSPVFEKKEEIKSEETKVAPIVQNEEEIAKEHFLNAMELMFEDRTLDRQFLDSPLSAEELAERDEKVKEAILALPSEYINKITIYRDGMIGRQQTLLLQAIMNIKDPLRRFEIVQMLLNKGANPLQVGFCQTEVEPLKEAEVTGDAELIALIKAAENKYNDELRDLAHLKAEDV